MHFKQAAAGPRVWDYCSGVAGLLCGACAVPGTEWPPGISGPRAAGLPVLQGYTPAACCLPDSKQVQEGQSTGRMLESAATPAKPCPQLERQQEVSSCGATMASWTFAAGSSSLQPAARASALCCQSIGPKQQRWKTCTHHLAGCMHPCPWTCRSAPHTSTATSNAGLHCGWPHNSNWRSPPPAISIGVPSFVNQDRHRHSQCWSTQQPGSLHKTRWFPPVTSVGPLGDCGNCPGLRWSCRHWPWCTSAQGRGSTPSAGWGTMTMLTCSPGCAVHLLCGAGTWMMFERRAQMQHCRPPQHAALPVRPLCRTRSLAGLYAGARW